MSEEFAAKVGIFVVSKLAYPFVAWLGVRTTRTLTALQLSQGSQIALTFAGIGGAAYLSLPGKLEPSLDFILGSVATVANTTAQVLSIAANQFRALEKTDLEGYFDRQLEFLEPYFDNDSPSALSDKKIPLAIAAPPPLLPKDYTIQNFPYYGKKNFQPAHIGDPDVDPLIDAYANLRINVVAMILADHQLPQMKLVKAIYLDQIKQIHPDRNTNSFTDANQQASIVNQAYTTIKNIMKSADDQADLIRPVLQHFHKGYFPPTPYIILFFMGGAFAAALTS